MAPIRRVSSIVPVWNNLWLGERVTDSLCGMTIIELLSYTLLSGSAPLSQVSATAGFDSLTKQAVKATALTQARWGP